MACYMSHQAGRSHGVGEEVVPILLLTVLLLQPTEVSPPIYYTAIEVYQQTWRRTTSDVCHNSSKKKNTSLVTRPLGNLNFLLQADKIKYCSE